MGNRRPGAPVDIIIVQAALGEMRVHLEFMEEDARRFAGPDGLATGLYNPTPPRPARYRRMTN